MKLIRSYIFGVTCLVLAILVMKNLTLTEWRTEIPKRQGVTVLCSMPLSRSILPIAFSSAIKRKIENPVQLVVSLISLFFVFAKLYRSYLCLIVRMARMSWNVLFTLLYKETRVSIESLSYPPFFFFFSFVGLSGMQCWSLHFSEKLANFTGKLKILHKMLGWGEGEGGARQ